MNFEVVIESLEELEVTNRYNIKRIELCLALDLGGLTPNIGLIESIVDKSNSEVHLMIRPRGGGFIYNLNELEIMKKDILIASKFKCKGVVFGALTNEKEIDIYKTTHLASYSKDLGLETTFHRAVDFTNNIFQSVEIIYKCGVSRILTSGGGVNVDEGIENIKKIFNQYDDIINIMPGGGINFSNAQKLINHRVKNMHFNIRTPKKAQSNIQMGIEYEVDEEKIRKITGIKLDKESYI